MTRRLMPELPPDDVLLQKFGPGTAVNMNSYKVVPRSERIYTFGLGGCACMIAIRADKVQLSHYSPVMPDAIHAQMVKSFRPEKIVAIVPGDWELVDGKYHLIPDPDHYKGLVAMADLVIPYGEGREARWMKEEPATAGWDGEKVVVFGQSHKLP